MTARIIGIEAKKAQLANEKKVPGVNSWFRAQHIIEHCRTDLISIQLTLYRIRKPLSKTCNDVLGQIKCINFGNNTFHWQEDKVI